MKSTFHKRKLSDKRGIWINDRKSFLYVSLFFLSLSSVFFLFMCCCCKFKLKWQWIDGEWNDFDKNLQPFTCEKLSIASHLTMPEKNNNQPENISYTLIIRSINIKDLPDEFILCETKTIDDESQDFCTPM